MGRLIGFAGMSHLGLVSSIATAAKGFNVVSYDSRAELIRLLHVGTLPVHEPELDNLLHRNAHCMTFTTEAADLARCAVVVLSMDVPTNQNNESDLSALDHLADSVVRNLADDTVLVVLSQVRPGYTRQLASRLEPVLTAKRIQLYYQVETLIFGRAVERAMFPERYMIGCDDPAQSLPAEFHKLLAAFKCPILPMRYESAELAKIAINIFLTASVTATNTLANICEKIGANWGEISPALKLDKRIGPHAYLAPGLGLSGGNLERDLVTVQNLAAEHGTDARLIDAFTGNSQYRRDWALRILHGALSGKPGKRIIAVWGLAYKQDTHSVKNSPSLALVSALTGMNVHAYDPQVKLDGVAGIQFQQFGTALDACNGADVLVVMTPWSEFPKIDLAEAASRLRQPIVIDPFGCLDAAKAEKLGLTYFKLGFSVLDRSANAA
jgi:UDPglucose 6-dehydrogenase